MAFVVFLILAISMNLKKKILLVDDEETLRWALHEALTEEGYDVENISDSVKALELVKKTNYDLVISDLRMPTMGGIQLISEIKKIRSKVKFIIITAYGSIETVIEAMHIGVSDFVTKPFKIEYIKGVIHKVFNDSLMTNNDRGDVARSEDIKVVYEDTWRQANTFFLIKNQQGVTKHRFYDYVVLGNLRVFLFGSISNDMKLSNFDNVIKAIFRYSYMTGMDKSPASLIKNINQYICKNIIQRFPVSLFCAVLDTQSQMLCFSGYGEELISLLYVPNKEVAVLESHPISLNMFPGTVILQSTVSFTSGSKIVLVEDSSLAWAVKNGKIMSYIDKLNEVMADGNISNCEYIAKDVMLQIERFRKSVGHEEDSAVMVSDMECEINKSYWEEVISLIIPIDNYEKILERFEKILSSVVVDNLERHQVITSVNEAVLNAVTFAYNKNKCGEVFIKFIKLRDEIIAEVCDHGCGFDIKNYRKSDMNIYADSAEKSGRGILLMKHLMDRVIIQSTKNTGTTVHMAKRVNYNEN